MSAGVDLGLYNVYALSAAQVKGAITVLTSKANVPKFTKPMLRI